MDEMNEMGNTWINSRKLKKDVEQFINSDNDENEDYYEYDDDINGETSTNNNMNTGHQQPIDSFDNIRFGDDNNYDPLDGTVSSSKLELLKSIVPQFDILNLIPNEAAEDDFNDTDHNFGANGSKLNQWRLVGSITREHTNVNTIMYIGSEKLPNYVMYAANSNEPVVDELTNLIQPRPSARMANSGKHRFRVVTNIAPPFVIESTKLDNKTCLIGDFCLKVKILN